MKSPQVGETISESGNARLYCIGNPLRLDVARSTESTNYPSDNDQSLVLQLTHGHISYFFPGDITRRVEQLLAPHHGSKTSNSASFIDAIDPKLILVSADRHRRRHFPTKKNLLQWQQADILVLITSQQGTTTFISDGKTMKAMTMSGKNFNW